MQPVRYTDVGSSANPPHGGGLIVLLCCCFPGEPGAGRSGSSSRSSRRPTTSNIRVRPARTERARRVEGETEVGTDCPAPLVIFFHGGGFRTGDKSSVPARLIGKCLDAGISVASANYRLSRDGRVSRADARRCRAIQFVRIERQRAGDRSRPDRRRRAAQPARASRFGSAFMTTWPIPAVTTRSRDSRRAWPAWESTAHRPRTIRGSSRS